MRIKKTTSVPVGSVTSFVTVKQVPYNANVTDTQFTVGVAATALAMTALRNHFVMVRNVSTAGQIIRIGTNPSFAAPPMGMPLYPGDGAVLDMFDTGVALEVRADAAGGLLEILNWQTSI